MMRSFSLIKNAILTSIFRKSISRLQKKAFLNKEIKIYKFFVFLVVSLLKLMLEKNA